MKALGAFLNYGVGSLSLVWLVILGQKIFSNVSGNLDKTLQVSVYNTDLEYTREVEEV